MKIFITGGNGFIGSHLVRLLTDQGIKVRCLLRKTSNCSRIAELPYEVVLGDIRDYTSLCEGMKGCDGVIHLASLSSWNQINSPLMEEVVVQGSELVFQAAQAMGNLRLVYVSSSTAINGSEQPQLHDEKSSFSLSPNHYRYAAAKKRVEERLSSFIEAGLPAVIVNPTEVYGPNDIENITSGTLIDFVMNSPTLICSGGSSIVFVEDVVEGIWAAFKRGVVGERYILGGENLSWDALANLTLSLLGRNKKVIQVPRKVLVWGNTLCKKLHIPFPLNSEVIAYAIRFWYMDNQKAVRELGLCFRSAKQTLAPTLSWLCDTGKIG